jgi:hypothetical protein
MRKQFLAMLMLSSSVALAGGNGNQDQRAQTQSPQLPQLGDGQKKVDLVIALDTSSSMDGLIDSARAKLWDVVLLLGKAKPQPIVRVGLISYGNDGYDRSVGWVRKEADLTTNLDDVYAKLFALRTNGGTEYVARAVHDATTQMQWDKNQDTLKIIFVAGNEPANQDPMIPVEKAVGEAREKGIFVNAIYCGSDSAGEAIGWREVAGKGSGQYAAIDQNHVVAVATPMDGELQRLSGELNKTYVGYGAVGGLKAANQAAQDRNAMSSGGHVAASRAAAKASAVYRNDEWDLVDAAKHGKKKVADMPVAELPAPMQSMAPAERERFVEEKSQERDKIQRRIAELSQKREAYIAEDRKKHAGGPAAFDDAVTSSIKTEAKKKGLAF